MTLEKFSKTLAISTVLLLLTNVMAVAPQYAQASTPTGVVIPLYTYPGSTWDTVVQAKNAHPNVPIIAIINPNSGSGSTIDANYVSGIQKLQSSGVVVLGYVSTVWAQRSNSAAQADIDNYKNWYNVNGIFFDEMSTSSSSVSYYANLDNYANQKGLTYTMGNPGTDTLSNYVGSVDNMVIYETGGLPNLNILGGWHTNYDKGNFSYLSYGVPTLDESFVSTSSNYVSYLYITNDNLSNPWDSLPPYFTQLVSALDTGVSSPINLPPLAIADSISMNKDISITVNVLGNDSDPDGDTLVIDAITVQPLNGQATINPDQTITYTPNLGYVGVDGFNYSISDGNGGTSSALVSAIVTSTIPTSSTLTIDSVDLLGKPAPGLWTEIYDGSSIIKQGYTPMTFDATAGKSYKVSTSDYQQYKFDHWEDQSTTRERTVTVSSDTTITAHYKTSSTLTIDSVDLLGKPAPGLWTEIYDGSSIIKQGYTPMTFDATAGKSYKVSTSDYQQYKFDHWEDQSTTRERTVTVSSDTTITAHYKTSVKLIVKAVNLSERPISGMWTELIQNGKTIKTGYTPKSFQVVSGDSYLVFMADYQQYKFDHWENGSTDRYRTMTPLQDTTIIAYYKQ